MSSYVTEAHFQLFYKKHKSFQENLLRDYRQLASTHKDTIARQTVIIEQLQMDLKAQSQYRSQLNGKLLISEEKITLLENRIENLEGALRITKPVDNNIDSQPEATSNFLPAIPDDPCEILVTGISKSLSQNPIILAKRMLLFIGLSSAINFIFSTRSWKYQHQKSDTTRGFVMKFSSQIVRNQVLTKLRSFRNLKSNSIFGTAHNNNSIKVTDLLPKSTYLLLLKARKMHKILKYFPPVVKNGMIYMRKNSYTPLIPIFTENDLSKLSTVQ